MGQVPGSLAGGLCHGRQRPPARRGGEEGRREPTPSPSPGSRPACRPGPEGSLGPRQELPQLGGGLQRGSRRTCVPLNQPGSDTRGRRPGGGALWPPGLALIWSPAPGIPGPLTGGELFRLGCRCRWKSLPFLFYFGRVARRGQKEGRGRQQTG